MPLKEEFITYISQEEGGMPGHTGPQRKCQGGQEAVDRREGKAQARASIGVSMRKARQAR